MLTRTSTPGAARGAVQAFALVAAMTLGLAGCQSLLDVELPTRVPGDVLDDPAMAGTIVLSTQGDFECYYSNYVAGSGAFTDEVFTSTEFFGFNQFNARVNHSASNNGDGCVSGNAFGVYRPLHTSIFTSEDAVRRLEKWTDAEVKDRTSLIATASLYGGFALTMMGEGYCQGVLPVYAGDAWDSGPALTPMQVLAEAEKRFTKAIDKATQPGDASVLNAALVGRARVRIDQGKKAEAAADARRVPANFRRDATYSGATPNRENQVYTDMVRLMYLSVEPPFRNLTVEGKPDPRVKVTDQRRKGPDGFTDLWWADKVPAVNTPIRLASWEEAQLIIAEAELGQEAVNRINAVRAKYGLASYTPASVNDGAEILKQIVEERRREFFLEGHRLGDMIRFKLTWPQGLNHKGNLIFGDLYCIPLAKQETDNNPNMRGK